ncbi:hypothetical protein V8J88_06130 [Massilia sp. W12]|uniref:hypothetical protein n=1 Tax=Massilia sp. W12 TaxID=3126507 RepID=UPI0030D113EB
MPCAHLLFRTAAAPAIAVPPTPSACARAKPQSTWPRRLLLLTALAGSFSVMDVAQAINKCEIDGKTIYSENPCAQGKNSTISAPASVPESERKSAEARAKQDKRQLAQIEKQKAKEEQAQARAAKQAALEQKRAKAKEDRCKLAQQRQRWSEQDAQSANPRQQTQAQKRAQRAREKAQLICAQ